MSNPKPVRPGHYAAPIRSRGLLTLWLAACLAVLVFAFVQRRVPDADIVVAYLMLALTFPVGFLVAAVLSLAFAAIDSSFGLTVPGGFTSNAATWVLFVIAGYLQWFVVVPWVVPKFRVA
jgi:hypothetical protein